MKLNIQDIEVLEKLSIYPSAAFVFGGNDTKNIYTLRIMFDDTFSAAVLEWGKAGPVPQPKKVIDKLVNLGILKKSREPRNSVFAHRCILNLNTLLKFEQTKEIAVQIALGTWFKNVDADWTDW